MTRRDQVTKQPERAERTEVTNGRAPDGHLDDEPRETKEEKTREKTKKKRKETTKGNQPKKQRKETQKQREMCTRKTGKGGRVVLCKRGGETRGEKSVVGGGCPQKIVVT